MRAVTYRHIATRRVRNTVEEPVVLVSLLPYSQLILGFRPAYHVRAVFTVIVWNSIACKCTYHITCIPYHTRSFGHGLPGSLVA